MALATYAPPRPRGFVTKLSGNRVPLMKVYPKNRAMPNAFDIIALIIALAGHRRPCCFSGNDQIAIFWTGHLRLRRVWPNREGTTTPTPRGRQGGELLRGSTGLGSPHASPLVRCTCRDSDCQQCGGECSAPSRCHLAQPCATRRLLGGSSRLPLRPRAGTGHGSSRGSARTNAADCNCGSAAAAPGHLPISKNFLSRPRLFVPRRAAQCHMRLIAKTADFPGENQQKARS